MSRYNQSCSVFGCSNARGRNRSLSFHKFPPIGKFVKLKNTFGIMEEVSQRKVWIAKLRMGKPVTENMRVCSEHFTPEDFIDPDVNKKKHSLITNAVPSLQLPKLSHEVKSRKPRRVRTSNNEYIVTDKENMLPSLDNGYVNEPTTSTQEVDMDYSAIPSTSSDNGYDERMSAAEVLVNLQNLPNKFTRGIDRSTQVKSGDLIEPFSNKIKTDKELSTLTGLQFFKLLGTIVELVTDLFPKNRKMRSVMSLKEEIIYTFMKLKTGLRYNVLSIIFGVNQSSCRLIFHECLIKLAKVLQYVITWPSKEEVLNNMPLSFQHFEKVRVVLDCTEIPLQQAKCLCCRLKTYSHYKKKHTVKIMTGVSPAGLVTYISRSYGDRSSDTEMFKKSSVLQLCEPILDSIMVDKGFLIGEIAEVGGIQIIQPPFLKNKSQLNRQEAILNAKIARARVHIERTNQRIKVFDILNKPFPLSLLHQVDNIMTIICAVVNLSNSIFSDEKWL